MNPFGDQGESSQRRIRKQNNCHPPYIAMISRQPADEFLSVENYRVQFKLIVSQIFERGRRLLNVKKETRRDRWLEYKKCGKTLENDLLPKSFEIANSADFDINNINFSFSFPPQSARHNAITSIAIFCCWWLPIIRYVNARTSAILHERLTWIRKR